MCICEYALLQIRIIANTHYCDPDSSGSWPRQNLHPGPSRLANTHYFHEYALLSFFYESLKTDSLLWSLTLRTVTEDNSSLNFLGSINNLRYLWKIFEMKKNTMHTYSKHEIIKRLTVNSVERFNKGQGKLH